jgi:hypothetical protein
MGAAVTAAFACLRADGTVVVKAFAVDAPHGELDAITGAKGV